MAASHSASDKPMTFSGKPKDKEYERCIKGLETFFEKYPVDLSGRMATINSYLRFHFPRMCFVGFYTVVRGKQQLQIGPYNGNIAILACGLIEHGKGVCGTAYATEKTQIVQDVRAIENYIACDEDTLSEIVLPVYARNRHDEPDAAPDAPKSLIAVLDIDADVVAAFDETDQKFLEVILDKFL